MKAITLWQPWASLLACEAKKYETRSWATNYRGEIAIHAAAIWPGDYRIIGSIGSVNTLETMAEALMLDSTEFACNMFDTLPRGSVIATAELIGCWKMFNGLSVGLRSSVCIEQPNQWKQIFNDELLFGDWTPGRYAWEFANMKMLPVPIPAKGMQGLWNWKGAA